MLGSKLNHVSKRGHKDTTRGDIIIPWGHMMTSSNGSIFRVTGPLYGESSSQRPVTRSFGVFFDLRLDKRFSKQSWGWRFETPSCSLWRHCNDLNIPSLVRYVMRLETVFRLFRKWLGAEQATSHYCPACRTTLIATRFRVAVICPIIQVPHCIRVFFYFVWFVFINHIFQFHNELCTYCNILDIYLS